MIKKDMLALVTRLKELINVLGMSQKAFAESIKISPAYISELLTLKPKNPGWSFFFEIARVHKVNLNYLFHGIGEMFMEDQHIQPEADRETNDEEMISQIHSVEELKWVLDHSPYFGFQVLAYASQFFYENHDIIKDMYKKAKAEESRKYTDNPSNTGNADTNNEDNPDDEVSFDYVDKYDERE